MIYVINKYDWREDVERVFSDDEFIHDRQVVAEFSKICDKARSSVYNRLLVLLARYFGKIPRDVRKFRLTLSQRKANSRVNICPLIPLEYLASLVYLREDAVLTQKRLFFVSPEQDFIEFALLQKANSTFYYVHSWDHLWKLNYSSKITYLVWNEFIENQLVLLYPKAKTRIIGNSLMSYLAEKRDQLKPKCRRRIIGWPMTYGYHDVHIEEKELVKALSDIVDDSMEIWLREYPQAQPLDDSLIRKNNIVVHKGSKLEFLEALDFCLHIGTTLGIEAEILGIPSVYLRIDKEFPALLKASKQPHHSFFGSQLLLSDLTLSVIKSLQVYESTWGELDPMKIIRATKKAIE